MYISIILSNYFVVKYSWSERTCYMQIQYPSYNFGQMWAWAINLLPRKLPFLGDRIQPPLLSVGGSSNCTGPFYRRKTGSVFVFLCCGFKHRLSLGAPLCLQDFAALTHFGGQMIHELLLSVMESCEHTCINRLLFLFVCWYVIGHDESGCWVGRNTKKLTWFKGHLRRKNIIKLTCWITLN